ncbi:MAG: NarK/NasA family nitrate transporter [Armatimonadetes bacterium]|nr:NarK/NasA family nitrate transporter [Armatimonadota bacterium]
MKLADLKQSGHAPSLFSAFLHFDISFMVWVILGAIAPFITTDALLTGQNLRVTPTALVQRAGQYTLVIKGPDAKKHQPKTVYNLLIKPGDPSTATRNSVKPVEKYVVNNADPATIAAVNADSQLIQIIPAPGAQGNPNENVIALQPLAALEKKGETFQPVANGIPTAFKLTLLAIPLLAAGFWRILLGVLADRFGSKRVGVASMAFTLLPLFVGWQMGNSVGSLIFIGFFLGLAGASFAVALPLASRWYPPHLQGVAMGIAGAGNSGTIMATIFAPLIAKAIGWHGVMGLLMIPVALTLVVFALLAKDPPTQARPNRVADYAAVLGQSDAWRFCLLYFVTFGGFVGLSYFFNTFFVDQYDAPKAAVGLWTWPFILAGSFLRPVGGALADRFGGIRMLTALYGVAIACAVGVGLCITHFAVVCALLFLLMGCLGMGNGSVFQLVPQRFKKEIGVMTGLVGAAGGVGGYYLNVAMGNLYGLTNNYASGFLAFAGIAVVALITLRLSAPAWTQSWLGEGGVAHPRHEPRRERIVVGPDGADLEPA